MMSRVELPHALQDVDEGYEFITQRLIEGFPILLRQFPLSAGAHVDEVADRNLLRCRLLGKQTGDDEALVAHFLQFNTARTLAGP